MAYEEYDRLAWGLVKEELRHLVKLREDLGFEETIARIIKPDKVGFYREQGALSDAKLKKVRATILADTQAKLGTFAHSQSRARMEEKGGKMDIDGSFAWDFKELGLTDVQNAELSRREKFLELRRLNFAIGKRKLIADVINCFVLINQHTLYRMLQRGATNREPLSLLASQFEDWAGFAAMFMLSHKFMGDRVGQNVFIPFCGGALLGKMAFTEDSHTEQGWDRHRLRFFDSICRGQIGTAPFEKMLDNEFQGKTGSVTLQITTWIPDDYYHMEQDWAQAQMLKFAKDHKDVFDYCINGVYGRHTPASDKRGEPFEADTERFGTDLGRIFVDRRWHTACQWK